MTKLIIGIALLSLATASAPAFAQGSCNDTCASRCSVTHGSGTTNCMQRCLTYCKGK